MEVHLTPDTERKLRDIAAAEGRPAEALVIRQAGLLGGIGVALGLGVSLAVSPALTVFADQSRVRHHPPSLSPQ